MRIRQRLQQDGVHHAEDGRRGSQPECKHEHSDGGEGRSPPQLVESEVYVFEEAGHSASKKRTQELRHVRIQKRCSGTQSFAVSELFAFEQAYAHSNGKYEEAWAGYEYRGRDLETATARN